MIHGNDVPAVPLTKESVYGNYFDEQEWDLQDPIEATNMATFSVDLTEEGMKKIFSAYQKITSQESDTNTDSSQESNTPDYKIQDPSAMVDIFVDRDLTYRYPVEAAYSSSQQALILEGTYLTGFDGFDGFWIVEKCDKNGNPYEKKLLTYYQGDNSSFYDQNIPRPKSVNVVVDNNGEVSVEWSKVKIMLNPVRLSKKLTCVYLV